MHIRRGTEGDFEAVLYLIKELAAFQGTPEAVLLTVDDLKRDAALFRCFVAEDATGVIVGLATYFFAYYSWVGKSLYLDDLYVQERARGQKTGSRLLKAIFDEARQEGCKRVRWQVSHWNKEAISFYQKCGAEIDREQLNCDFDEKGIQAFSLPLS